MRVTAGVLAQEMLERLAQNFGVDSPDQLTDAQQKVPASSTSWSYLVLSITTALSVEIFLWRFVVATFSPRHVVPLLPV